MKHSTEINFSRAVLILLVVLVHIVHFGTTYPAVKEAILAFMMPAFLFITGYLANVDKPAKAFGRYVLQIFLPYFIMVVGFSVLSYFLPVRDKLTELSVNAISERLFVTSIGPYWFLYVMLGCGLLYRLSGLIVRNKERSFLRILTFGLLLYGVSFVVPLMSVQNVMYYFLGAALRQCNIQYTNFIKPSRFALFLFIFIIVFLGVRTWVSFGIVWAVYEFLAFTSWLSTRLPQRLEYSFNWLGMNTLPIYLFHPIFTLASKYYLPFFAWDQTAICFTIVTLLFSVSGSLMVAFALDKTHLTQLFGRKAFFRNINEKQ